MDDEQLLEELRAFLPPKVVEGKGPIAKMLQACHLAKQTLTVKTMLPREDLTEFFGVIWLIQVAALNTEADVVVIDDVSGQTISVATETIKAWKRGELTQAEYMRKWKVKNASQAA